MNHCANRFASISLVAAVFCTSLCCAQDPNNPDPRSLDRDLQQEIQQLEQRLKVQDGKMRMLAEEDKRLRQLMSVQAALQQILQNQANQPQLPDQERERLLWQERRQEIVWIGEQVESFTRFEPNSWDYMRPWSGQLRNRDWVSPRSGIMQDYQGPIDMNFRR